MSSPTSPNPRRMQKSASKHSNGGRTLEIRVPRISDFYEFSRAKKGGAVNVSPALNMDIGLGLHAKRSRNQKGNRLKQNLIL